MKNHRFSVFGRYSMGLTDCVLYHAILWAAHGEEILRTWFSTNYNVELHAFVANGKYCVVNNTYAPQDTAVYTDNGSFDLHLEANEIRWYSL